MAVRRVTEERVRFTVIINKDLHTKVNKICDKKNMPMSEFIRKAIERSTK